MKQEKTKNITLSDENLDFIRELKYKLGYKNYDSVIRLLILVYKKTPIKNKSL